MLKTQDFRFSADVVWDGTGLSCRGWGGQPFFLWREWPMLCYGASQLMCTVVGHHFWSLFLLNLNWDLVESSFQGALALILRIIYSLLSFFRVKWRLIAASESESYIGWGDMQVDTGKELNPGVNIFTTFGGEEQDLQCWSKHCNLSYRWSINCRLQMEAPMRLLGHLYYWEGCMRTWSLASSKCPVLAL